MFSGNILAFDGSRLFREIMNGLLSARTGV